VSEFRIIDTGLRGARENIAFDSALLESHKAGTSPDTVRFLRFRPSALVGRHQALSREVHLDHCRDHGIEVARRITGGGAIYFDEGQLGWELVFRRNRLGGGDLAGVTRNLCEAAAAGLSRLGVDARFRPRNDIEVDGRKMCGTGGFFDGSTLFFQGTVLVDLDPKVMMSALRVPRAKLARHKLDSAEQRVVTLRELLGDATPELPAIQRALVEAFAARFALGAVDGELGPRELEHAQALYREDIGTEAFVSSIDEPPAARGDLAGHQVCPGGSITVYLRLEGPAQNRIRAALVTGDFFITPPRIVYDLESRLRGVYLDDLPQVVREFFEQSAAEALSVSPDDFVAAFQDALREAPGIS
jgi:lipoate-protein ligase A